MASLFNEMRARLNQIRLAPLQRKLVETSAKTFIFPCKFITPINNTNAGLKGANAQRDMFYQWEAIISGNESIMLNWKNSTKYEQVKVDDPTSEDFYKQHWKVTFQKGDYFKVFKINDGGETDFGTTDFGSFGEFANIANKTTVSCQTTFKVTLNALTDFYLIPNEVRGDSTFDDNQIFYISGFTNYYDSKNKFVFSEINFTSLGNQLSQSGQSIYQRVYFSSPGSGWAYPKLIFDQYDYPKDFKINEEYAKDTGVRSIQIEVTGNASILSVECYGSPLEKLNFQNQNIYAPRKLLVESLRLPIQDDFLLVSSANNTFYFTDIKLTGTTSFDNWMDRRKWMVGDKIMQFTGIVETNGTQTYATNTLDLTIADLGNVVTDDFLKLLGDNGKIRVDPSYFYYDGTQHDDTGKPFDGIGIKELDLTKMPRKRFSDLLNQAGFYLNHINQLPYELNSKVNWSVRDIYILGGFLNRVTFGWPWAWRKIYHNSNMLYPNMQKQAALINKDVYDFFSNAEFASNLNPDKSELKKLPMEIFQKDESDILGTIFGSSASTTSIHFTLTDKIIGTFYDRTTKAKVKDEICSTLLLDQNWKDNTRVKVSEASYAMYPLDDTVNTDIQGQLSYMICGIGIRMLGTGDCRLTFLKDDLDLLGDDPNNPQDWRNSIVFQTVVKSEAGYRGNNPREYLTFIKTNFIEALTNTDAKFTWPEANSEPAPEVDIKDISYVVNQENKKVVKELVASQPAGDTSFNDWLPLQEILVYDFKDKGYQTPDAIRAAFERITISNQAIWAEGHSSVDGDTTTDTDQGTSTSFEILLANVKDTIPTKDENAFFKIQELDTNISGGSFTPYSNSKTNTYISAYFDGTRLMLTVNIHTEIHVQSISMGGVPPQWLYGHARISYQNLGFGGTIKAFVFDE